MGNYKQKSLITAFRCNYKTYCDLIGRKCPESSKDKEGYLIGDIHDAINRKFIDKDKFDENFICMDRECDRLSARIAELKSEANELLEYINEDGNSDSKENHLIDKQYRITLDYITILRERLKLIENEKQ